MNTTLKVTVVIVVVALLAVLGVGFAFAQGMSPWGGGYGMMGNYGFANQDGTPAPYGMMGNGYGMTLAPARSAGVNGQGMIGGGMAAMSGVDTVGAMHTWMSTTGGMHDLVWSGLADALGLTQDDLSARLAGGETLAQIAEAQGVTPADLATALEASVKAGLEQAVADGALTQAQSDQMLSHMAGNYEWMLTQMGAGMGFGAGSGNCHGNLGPESNS